MNFIQDLAKKDGKIRGIKKELKAAKEEATRLTNDIDGLSDTIAELNAREVKATGLLEKSSTRNEEMRSALSAMIAERDQARADAAAAESRAVAAEARAAAAEASAAEAEAAKVQAAKARTTLSTKQAEDVDLAAETEKQQRGKRSAGPVPSDNLTAKEKGERNEVALRPQSPATDISQFSEEEQIAYQAKGGKKQRPAAAALDFSGEENSSEQPKPQRCDFCPRSVGKEDDDHTFCSECTKCLCMANGQSRCDSGRWVDWSDDSNDDFVCVDCDM